MGTAAILLQYPGKTGQLFQVRGLQGRSLHQLRGHRLLHQAAVLQRQAVLLAAIPDLELPPALFGNDIFIRR